MTGRLMAADGNLLVLKMDSPEWVKRLRDQAGTDLLDVTVKKHSTKRSRSANSLAWEMITIISGATHQPKDDVYKECIRRYGQTYFPPAMPAEDFKKLARAWNRHGLGWQSEIIQEESGMVDGILYIGSSAYSKEEMSNFLEGLKCECLELGIVF